MEHRYLYLHKPTLIFMDGTEYITLKEASEISGYSPDYIGQLIRGGKLTGKQVYANVAWVTTRDALLGYLDGKGKTKKLSQHSILLERTTESAIDNTSNETIFEGQASQGSSAVVVSQSTPEEVYRWERIFRVFSVVIIVFSILFLALLLRVFVMLLDEKALHYTASSVNVSQTVTLYA